MSILKPKPYKSVDAGQFHFNFFYKEGSLKGTYLEVTCDSGIFAFKVGGNTKTYGYLLAAAEQGRTDQLQGYAVTLYIPAMTIAEDQGLCDDCQKAIMKWQKRKERQGASNAAKVTDAEDMASDALMREAIERGKPMSRQQRRKMERESRKQMREILREDADKSAEPEQSKK